MGHLIAGFSLSFTVTVKEQADVLPDASVAIYTFSVVPTGKIELLGKPLVNSTCTLQLSVAITSNVVTAPQIPKSVLILRGVGHVIAGFSLSFTITVKEQADVLPDASVAVYTFSVVPTEKIEPLGKPLVNSTCTLQLSVAVTSNVVTAPQTPKSVLILRGVGHVITGFWLSITFTLKVQADAPITLVAVAVTVVVPTEKKDSGL